VFTVLGNCLALWTLAGVLGLTHHSVNMLESVLCFFLFDIVCTEFLSVLSVKTKYTPINVHKDIIDTFNRS